MEDQIRSGARPMGLAVQAHDLLETASELLFFYLYREDFLTRATNPPYFTQYKNHCCFDFVF